MTLDTVQGDAPARIAVLHGPNLNLLGMRQPDIYGHTTLAQIDAALIALGQAQGLDVICQQHSGEAALVDAVGALADQVLGWVINAAAYTHTSLALRDALLAANKPFVEVHLSNVHARESFRHRSYLADVAIAVVQGMGPDGYLCALAYLMRYAQILPSFQQRPAAVVCAGCIS